MLANNEPADYLPLVYRNQQVRIHKHTVTNKTYFVLADICKVLKLTNPSYISHKISSQNKCKHRISNTDSNNPILWINYDGLVQLFDTLPNNLGYGAFWAWCRSVTKQ